MEYRTDGIVLPRLNLRRPGVDGFDGETSFHPRFRGKPNNRSSDPRCPSAAEVEPEDPGEGGAASHQRNHASRSRFWRTGDIDPAERRHPQRLGGRRY